MTDTLVPTLPTEILKTADWRIRKYEEIARVGSLLEALGDDSMQVARTLKDLGIRGEPHCKERCPVAEYLFANRVLDPRVNLNAVDFRIFANSEERYSATIPQPVSNFIHAFDKGAIPGLAR